MPERIVYITDYDYKRLGLLLESMNSVPQNRRNDLSCLENELESCRVVAPNEIPANVVTLNSRIRYFNLNSKEERIVTLVFPSNADLSKGRVSIISPLGAAILGYAEGDVVVWKTFSGRKTIRIEEVIYQPEAAGDFHL
ncbi:RNA polymerase-binding protein Rnk [Desulfuromonas versatilis]|uniref:RNA polymerase-binding protein Rnk n=1 Tax=Desulfuromonas versatilis TaxID=2802975 RepID=A0ABN6DZE4_9BACT|nr:nucleoside diphosphate kinase regulator [Desulfuromonas versatilis]BCR04884.1 RNA polymerase-binding protein Rnk [Desulfuromonas versatilis]